LLVLFNPVLNTVAIGEKYGMSEIGRKISPNHYLSTDVPPAIIFFGTEDRLNEGGKEFIVKAKDLGLQTQMYMAPGQGHGFFNRSPWQERTAFLMDEFLTARGYLKGKPTLDLPPSGLAMMKYELAQ
jgi:acetyl esterase/lipase